MSSLLQLFLRGLAMGFAIAAPVGAIGVLCIRRTLAGGRSLGLATGLGAATADAVYGAIAAFGVTALSVALLGARAWLGLAGGLFLVYLGARTIAARPIDECADERMPASAPSSLLAAYGSTFLLTLGNPSTILAFVAVFAALGVSAAGAGLAGAAAIVLGVFCGSAAWWLLLSTGIGLVRHRLSGNVMVWIDRLSGAVIVVFGLLAAAGSLQLLGVVPGMGR
jgi:threonine/homoserine/homoserine lactone efflux protein